MPYSSASLPARQLSSSWEFRSGPCVFHCWRLPVPVDLRAMLTAIFMEHGPRFAWLDGSRAFRSRSHGRRPLACPLLKDTCTGFNAILIRPRPGAAQILKSQTNWPLTLPINSASRKTLVPPFPGRLVTSTCTNTTLLKLNASNVCAYTRISCLHPLTWSSYTTPHHLHHPHLHTATPNHKNGPSG